LKNAKNYFIDAKLYKLTESEIPHHTDGSRNPFLLVSVLVSKVSGLSLEGFRSRDFAYCKGMVYKNLYNSKIFCLLYL